MTTHAECHRVFRLQILTLAVLLAACTNPFPASSRQPSLAQAPTQTLRGHLVYGHEAREFTPCGAELPLWVADGTGGDLAAVYQSLALGPYTPLFVEVRGAIGPAPDVGFAAGYSAQINVTELRRAAAESAGCGENLNNVLFRAVGVEPFWSMDIEPHRLRLRRMGFDDQTFALRPRPSSDTQRLNWHGEDEAGTGVDVVLTEARCSDPMSGAVFPYRASVKLAQAELNGCALAGPIAAAIPD